MTIFRVLNLQGLAGLGASICLALLLVLQKGDTRRWEGQSAKFEKLYRDEQAAFATTVAHYRTATEAARTADRANAARVAAEQRAITERISDDYEARLAVARTSADRLRQQAASIATDRGIGGATRMPALSPPAGEASQAAGEDGLFDRLLATEQAIQLDELIKWVKAQAKVDQSPDPGSR